MGVSSFSSWLFKYEDKRSIGVISNDIKKLKASSTLNFPRIIPNIADAQMELIGIILNFIGTKYATKKEQQQQQQ